jgi:hypothetical protein
MDLVLIIKSNQLKSQTIYTYEWYGMFSLGYVTRVILIDT